MICAHCGDLLVEDWTGRECCLKCGQIEESAKVQTLAAGNQCDRWDDEIYLSPESFIRCDAMHFVHRG